MSTPNNRTNPFIVTEPDQLQDYQQLLASLPDGDDGDDRYASSPAASEPAATGLFDLHPAVEAPENELLRNRFLSRKGSLLIVGNTGIGKSSLTMQMMMHWAVGVGCFGIQPVRPLKSLLVQGENDEADLADMRDGVAGSLQLNEEQRATVNRSVVVCHEVERSSEEFVDEVLDRLIISHQPDLVWIDPVFQYLGGDSNQQEVVSSFLRQQLGRLLKRHQCAVVLIHHTNKPGRPNNNSTSSNPNLRAYDAAGSAEFGNWPRAILSLQATKSSSIYKLVAAKRGGRLGWRMPDGTTASFTKLLTHSRQPGIICWEEVEAAVNPAPAAPNNQPAVNAAGAQPAVNAAPNNGLNDIDRAVLAGVPIDGSVEKKALIENVRQLSSIGENAIGKSLKRLIPGRLEEFKVRRPKTRPAVYLRRVQPQQPQPAQEAPPLPTSPANPTEQPRQPE